MDATTLAAADHAARHWTCDGAAQVRLGSEAHKQACCRMSHETCNSYNPPVIPWPKLDPEALGRLVLGVPGSMPGSEADPTGGALTVSRVFPANHAASALADATARAARSGRRRSSV